jgi:glycosyltransferase involved in cell wall biosynthesis
MTLKPIDNPQHISILFPTRKRFHYLKNLFDSLETTTEEKKLVDVWLYIDSDDFDTKEFIDDCLNNHLYSFDINYIYSSPSVVLGEMYNTLLKECSKNPGIYMFCADKILFITKNWDKLVRRTFNSYPDRILFAYAVDPHMTGSDYGAYGLFLSAEWINLLGKAYTEYFPFWYEDSWLAQVSWMVQRRIRLNIQLDLQGGKGVTLRMRNLVFWDRFFANTIDERVEEAKLLRGAIYPQNSPELYKSEKEGHALAQKFILDWKYRTKEGLSINEKNCADPNYLNSPPTNLYLTAELRAANYLREKADKFLAQSQLSEALEIWDNLLDASQETKDALSLEESFQAQVQQIIEIERTSIEAEESGISSLAILAYIKSLPSDWHGGGALPVEVLEAIVKHIGQRKLLHSVETGSGASTLLLSHISQDHKVFSYDCGGNGLTVVCTSPLLNRATVEFIEGPTQKTLPYYKFETKIQLALIDGPHGYPFPEIEYYFIYPHLEENALLIIDDIWIPNLYNLFDFLKEDEMFELIEVVGKTAFFRRTAAPCLNPIGDDWFLQNYNKSRFPINPLPSFQKLSFSQTAKSIDKVALVFFPHNPYPPRTGAHQRCLAMLGGLKELGYNVTLFGSNLITDNPWPVSDRDLQALQEYLGVRVDVYQGTHADRQFIGQVMELSQARGDAENWDIYTPPGLREHFRQLFRKLSPEIVVINYSLWGELAIGEEFESVFKVIDCHDLYSLNTKMRQALGQYLLTEPFTPNQIDSTVVAENFYSKLKLEAEPSEYRIFDRYDCTITMSVGEAELIRQHTHQTQVDYIPMTFTSELVNNTYTEVPLFVVGPNPFNVQGYVYFAQKVLPIILNKLPEFSLQVVGSICQKLSPVEGIELLGYVPELKILYAGSPFAICPLIGGTGQQVKIVEAMAHGVPVIALRNVAESSPIEHGVNGFIAENAEEFAEYTIQLWRDRELCRRLGESARETIAKNFSENVLVETLAAIAEQAKEKLKLVTSNPNRRVNVPIIIIDGVFFQLYQTGIARLWKSLLEEWAKTPFSKHIIVIDRAGTAPKVPGIRYRPTWLYNVNDVESDRAMLQQLCDEERADLFISTYYTTPISTPSVFMAYDMIPENLGWDTEHPNWRGKHHAIQYASAYTAISQNTARDLVQFFPDIPLDTVTVSYCGVSHHFVPASSEEINRFKTKYGISKPYFLLVGPGFGYKNSTLFFKAFSQLYSKQGFDIVCTGGGFTLEPEWRECTFGSTVHMLQLNDEELSTAYSGAVALVYPSKLEGFGLPVLEAMACGCPVITCPNASIPEVAAQAALYVKDDDVEGFANALCEVQKPLVRQALIATGLEQAEQFSWSKMATIVSSVLIDTTLQYLNLKEINLIIFPDWSVPEESLGWDLERVIKAIATHPNKHQITLLVDSSGISEDDANLVLSGVAMNLLLQEELDVTEGPTISLVGQLGEIQWETLLPRLQARIVLEHENQEAIAQAKATHLPCYELDRLMERYSDSSPQ